MTDKFVSGFSLKRKQNGSTTAAHVTVRVLVGNDKLLLLPMVAETRAWA